MAAMVVVAAPLLCILYLARHHPRLATLDLHLLLVVVSDSPTFRLDLILTRPCPCTNDSIFACLELLPTFRKAIITFVISNDILSTYDTLVFLHRVADSALPAEFYNIILHALVRLRRHEDAIHFYDEMISTHCIPPNVYTFNILINSSCRAEGVDIAIGWFQEMRRWSCHLLMVQKAGNKEGGEAILDEMFDSGFILNIATYNRLFDGLHTGRSL
ncbi:hypothetical protein GUJ93_ZPchr0050g33545 [Zizania palustris]|uniref:Pentatricopeptide repeat-containing protein n=1 Tax=Zizania palustris TaxID=103762 RepID=A0A8J5VEK8_ZIZPA|nr:hypothetical protein GUJ93_ZPchr0050g33545 [Zizania palustris]